MVNYTETKLTFAVKLWVHDRREPQYELQLIGVHNNSRVDFKHYSASMIPHYSISNQTVGWFSGRRMFGELIAELPAPGAGGDYWPATMEIDEKKYDLKLVFCGRHNDNSDLYAAAFVEL
ncbi:hypothetical protein BC939DRAFT_492468 [Gamsiella multidivaricata]|uniref:uncharacterized protein n=1 Tax=Gamsiella multidivaricata TaxID=101098 RepID=UPI00221E7DA0|nr:uncharacterized protein BC939DRAFT_492468 [Gamsiella multidivaricata]KAI7824857.1 hypothetical protein BC939DRAFT_492468 [Gamsiella multidivaricata]